MSKQPCEYNGDVKDGAIVPCPNEATVVIRLRGIAAIQMGKRNVCEKHREHCMSEEVKRAGRDWQIDRYLSFFDKPGPGGSR